MSKYIDADSLYERLEQRYRQIVEKYADLDAQQYIMGFGEAVNALKNEPAADVQEVKHAKWVHYGEYAQCSNCEHVTDDICYEGDNDSGYYTVLPHYCSNCGSKMENDS